jgi:hypothetical protein
VVEAELNSDPDRLGYAVLVRVDRVVARGQVNMSRDEAQAGAASD